MTETTKPYRLLPGFKHWKGAELLKDGDVVELTEQQADAFSDRFVAVGDGFDAPQPKSESGEGGEGGEGGEDVLKGTVGDVQELVAKIDAIDTLKGLAVREQEGANRKGVLSAIERRIEQLSS